MSNRILISVIIPTFNSADTLLLTLESLKKQNFSMEQFEVLVIDDGSTDNTYDLVKKYLDEKILKLRYFKQNNSGCGMARNLGLRNIKSNVVAFTDADCIVDDNWLATIHKSIVVDNNTIISGYTYTKEVLYFPWKTAPVDVNQSGVTANLAINYNNLNGILFSEKFSFLVGDDLDFVMRIENLGYSVKHLSEMRVMHPPHINTLRKIIKRLAHRSNEVLLHSLYGDRVTSSFSWPFRPICRISPVTVLYFSSIILMVCLIFTNNFKYIILIIAVASIFYIFYFYKFTVLNNLNNEKVPIKYRFKMLIYIFVYIPFFILARISGSIKHRHLMI